MAGRVGAWSVAHRRVVVGAWLALLVAGGVAAATVGPRLTFQFALPGQPAYVTNQRILHRFGNGGDTAPLVLVAAAERGELTTGSVRRRFVALDALVQHTLPGARVASFATTGNRAFISPNRRAAFAFVYPRVDLASSDPYQRALPVLSRALERSGLGGDVRVTGATILANGGQGGGNSVVVETLVAGVGALVVLAVVFGSVLALLPLIVALIAIPTTFLGVAALTYVVPMSTLVQNIIALIGLGVAIDYALLIATRWREARQSSDSNRDAVQVAMNTAGNSVLVSGLTVAVSLAALALTSVPFLRSIGLAGLLVALVSVAVATTLLPVLLDRFGTRLEWPRRHPARTVSRRWTQLATAVVRHRILAALLSLAVLGTLIAPVLSLHLGEPQARATASTAPPAARSGYEQLVRSGLGAGVLRPTEILYRGPAPTRALARAGIAVIAPAGWRSGAERVADAWTPADASTAAGARALVRIRTALAGRSGVRVGGTLAEDEDFIHALYGPDLAVIVAVIVLVTFVLLARALRSIWLPVKALALNALSLAAAFGVVTFLWQQGHLTQALFASPATGAVTLWVPLAVFSLLFGLSMDYEVFILTRFREEYAADSDSDAATVRALGHTGRLVSSGALILCLAFIALGGVPQTDVKILSTGLAAGIIIDATIIRGILVPSLLALLGAYNWAMPRSLAAVLRIRPDQTR